MTSHFGEDEEVVGASGNPFPLIYQLKSRFSLARGRPACEQRVERFSGGISAKP
jgi:hypothetical protein